MELSRVPALLLLLVSSVQSAPLKPCWEENKAYVGFPLKKPGGNNDYGFKGSVEECQAQCQAVEGCAWWNWDQDQHCWLKTQQGSAKGVKNSFTGPRECPQEELKIAVDWSEWSDWGSCSKSCVGNDLVPGEKVRQRSCRGLLKGGVPHQDGITPCNTDRERLPCYGETTKVNICPSPAKKPIDDTRKILKQAPIAFQTPSTVTIATTTRPDSTTPTTPKPTTPTTPRPTTPTTPRPTTTISPTTKVTTVPSSSFKFSCASSPCHSSATCSDTSRGYSCSCLDGEAGDPYGAGCVDKDRAKYEDIVVLFGLL